MVFFIYFSLYFFPVRPLCEACMTTRARNEKFGTCNRIRVIEGPPAHSALMRLKVYIKGEGRISWWGGGLEGGPCQNNSPSLLWRSLPSSLPLRSGSSNPVLPRGGRPKSVGRGRPLALSSVNWYICLCMGCKCQFSPKRCMAARRKGKEKE